MKLMQMNCSNRPKATGEAEYDQYIQDNYTVPTNTMFNEDHESAYFVGNSGMLGLIAYMWADAPDATVKTWYDKEFVEWREMMATRSADSPWNLTLTDFDFFWGSNMQVSLKQ